MTGLLDTARRIASKSDGRRVLRAAPAVALAAVVALGVAAGTRTQTQSAAFASTDAALYRVIDQPGTRFSQSRFARSSISWAGGPTTAQTGETVTVYVSAALSPELGTPQTWADFLAGVVHGPEISALTAYIATFEEMQEACGEYALGCYGPNRMMSMGETMFGITAAEVVRHEYGHHVAFHRLNPPWQAISWGPKHWASTVNVCRRAEQGSAYPDDSGDHYSLDPAEAWAETYRLLDERKAGATGAGWQIIDSSFYPDEAAFQAAEQDVLQPWTTSRTTVFRHRFAQKTKRVWTVQIGTPLDGLLDVTVTLPKNGLQDVVLLDGGSGTVLQNGLWASRTMKKITTTICGPRSLVLRVMQKGAFGRVTVVASTP